MSKYSPLTSYLGRFSDSVTLTWPELNQIVGGLPASAAAYREWWSGERTHVLAWRSAGFEIENLVMGSKVTFMRRGSGIPTSKEKHVPTEPNIFISPQAGGSRTSADIILISCVKTKRDKAALAKDLYISDLFRKERAFAEGSGAPWYILSAEYGLVSPEQLLEPYERYLPRESLNYRQEWGSRVVRQLGAIENSIKGKVIEIHAGESYLGAVTGGLESRGAVVVAAWGGKTFGQILQWYASGAREKQEVQHD